MFVKLEPFVVEAEDIGPFILDCYTRMARNVYVLDQRIDAELWAKLPEPIKEVYEPVYLDLPISGSETPDFTDKPLGAPHAYWIRVEKVPASERIRYPMLAPKCNYSEGIGLGDLRELYSWDGLGFKLRDPKWGRD
jgi:hypothetical protein